MEEEKRVDSPPSHTTSPSDRYQLDHIGVHCSVCKVLDFLPYKCECGQQFCQDHREPSAHNCIKQDEKVNKMVHPCPICNCLIKVSSLSTIDEVISRHIDSGECGNIKSNVPKSYACNLKGCKATEFVKVLCDKCKVNYCLKHRFPSSHSCPGSPIISSTKSSKTSISVTSTSNKSTSNTTPASTSKKITSDTDYYSAQKKQKNDLSSLRQEQQQRYISNDLGEIRIIQTNGYRIQSNFKKTDTLRAIKDFINNNRSDGAIPYAICRDPNGQSPFSIQDLDKNLQQLNLLPVSTLFMITLDDGSGRVNNSNNTNNNNNNSNNNYYYTNNQNQEGFLSYLNPFRYFK